MKISERIKKCQTLLVQTKEEVAQVRKDFEGSSENSALVQELLCNIDAVTEDLDNAGTTLDECDESIINFRSTLEQLADKL